MRVTLIISIGHAFLHCRGKIHPLSRVVAKMFAGVTAHSAARPSSMNDIRISAHAVAHNSSWRDASRDDLLGPFKKVLVDTWRLDVFVKDWSGTSSDHDGSDLVDGIGMLGQCPEGMSVIHQVIFENDFSRVGTAIRPRST